MDVSQYWYPAETLQYSGGFEGPFKKSRISMGNNHDVRLPPMLQCYDFRDYISQEEFNSQDVDLTVITAERGIMLDTKR